MMLMRSHAAVDVWRRDEGTAQEPQRDEPSVAHHQTPQRHTSNSLTRLAFELHASSQPLTGLTVFRQNTVLRDTALPRATVQMCRHRPWPHQDSSRGLCSVRALLVSCTESIVLAETVALHETPRMA